MVIALILSIPILLIYSIILWDISNHWRWKDGLQKSVSRSVSVVVAARNEESYIVECVATILNNAFPADHLEVIVVNDHSTDGTLAILENSISDSRLKILSLPKNVVGKKEAITFGIKHSSADIILTTDADCKVGPEWVKSMIDGIDQGAFDFVSGPVRFEHLNSPLGRYQQLDLMGMMAVTSYGIKKRKYYLANGANMGFKRKAFVEVGGFEGNTHLASGDDLFLVQKMASSGVHKVGFIQKKKAIVTTRPETSLKDLMNQRKRWATKSMAYKDERLKALLALVFLCNLMIPFMLVWGVLFCWVIASVSVILFYFKLIIDFYFLKALSKSYIIQGQFKHFIISEFMTIGVVIYSGIMGLFPSSYRWKEREVR